MNPTDLFDNIRPFYPVLNTVKRMFFDKPSTNVAPQNTEHLKRERETFIQENRAQGEPLSIKSIEEEEEEKYYTEEEMNFVRQQYQQTITMYHNQSIEMAKFLDELQKAMCDLRVDLHHAYNRMGYIDINNK